MKAFAERFPLLFWLILVVVVSGPPVLAHAQTASQLYAQGVQAYDRGEIELAKVRLQRTLQVDQNFRPASALLSRIAQEQHAAGGAGAGGVLPVSRKTLDQMVVPVEFKDTTLQSAVEFLRQRIEQTSGGKSQVNFVLNVPPELANKRVTLRMDHVPVTELLEYVGKSGRGQFFRREICHRGDPCRWQQSRAAGERRARPGHARPGAVTRRHLPP